MPVRLCRTSQAVNRVVSLRLEVSRAEHCPNDPSSQSVAVSAEHRSTKKPSMHGIIVISVRSQAAGRRADSVLKHP